ncbi:MAG: Tim44 domain-containing protein [Candidatus Methylomirabilis sp.]
MTRTYGRLLGLVGIAAVVALQAMQLDAWARAGGGRSMGSRGSRSYSSPSRSYRAPAIPAQPRTDARAPSAAPLPAPAGGGFMRSLAGGLLGGILGGMLFRSLGFAGFGGMGGGFGLMDLVILAAIGFAIYWVVKQRRERRVVSEGPYQRAELGDRGPELYRTGQAQSTMLQETDLERGVSYVRQMDPGFDEGRFRDTCANLLFRVQAAWGHRELEPLRAILTPEMYIQLSEDVERYKTERRINHLENIAVRSVELTEAWQEQGQDYVTVRFLANLLDYTVEEGTGNVVEGNRVEPVTFEEFWTFTRPVGPNPWRLSAINQAE